MGERYLLINTATSTLTRSTRQQGGAAARKRVIKVCGRTLHPDRSLWVDEDELIEDYINIRGLSNLGLVRCVHGNQRDAVDLSDLSVVRRAEAPGRGPVAYEGDMNRSEEVLATMNRTPPSEGWSWANPKAWTGDQLELERSTALAAKAGVIAPTPDRPIFPVSEDLQKEAIPAEELVPLEPELDYTQEVGDLAANFADMLVMEGEPT